MAADVVLGGDARVDVPEQLGGEVDARPFLGVADGEHDVLAEAVARRAFPVPAGYGGVLIPLRCEAAPTAPEGAFSDEFAMTRSTFRPRKKAGNP